ncbi:MAG: hypothetical protein RLY86_2074 [Pseudomonadota bacterium]|jgi:hypothetical protein
MPTVRRFAGCRIAVYPREHGVPHFHLESPEAAVVVEIATLRVLHGDARKYPEAMDWAARHKDVLMGYWTALNGRE